MMSTPYERAKTGRLKFKGGALPTVNKSIDKKKKKKPKQQDESIEELPPSDQSPSENINGGEASTDIYSIDAARRMKYDQLFPVEAKKFGYDPKEKLTSVEKALDDRVKKKADRYCK
ncbi:hypothetical protein IFM89_013277 [Coptis chinensis]|uniref:Uncharacterized protein n=1 Tax=Coptis chinensis TaxID=261450 RepID=A0A835IW12_9MAGN|nr:hypothetical protein IFM89_013277 [Coptis chinensis]